MSGWGSARRIAQLHCATALGVILAAPAIGQAAPSPPSPSAPGELDPSAPLDPMPDLGVAWPVLDAQDQAPAQPGQAATAAAEDAGERRYTIVIEGLPPIGGADDLLKAFRQQ